MQKIYLFLILAVSILSVNAQITITSADMPVPGLLPRFTLPDSVSSIGIDYTTNGANANWDYTYLIPEFQRVDTFTTVPFQYQLSFTGATVARPLPVGGPGGGGPGGVTIDAGYEFFKNSSSKYERLGYGGTVSGSPFPLSLVNSPKDVVYNFPLNYNDKDTSISTAILDITGFAYIEQHQTRINHADGWGTIFTPYKQFQAIRVKTDITGYDSISYNGMNFAQPRNPSTNYKWLANDEKVPVMQINVVQFFGQENVQSIIYRDTVRNVPYVGITPPAQQIDAKVYPNPAQNKVQINWEASLGKEAKLEVWSVEGKCLMTQLLNNQQQTSLNIEGLEPGLYFVKLSGSNKMFTGTLSVARE